MVNKSSTTKLSLLKTSFRMKFGLHNLVMVSLNNIVNSQFKFNNNNNNNSNGIYKKSFFYANYCSQRNAKR